MQKQQTKSGSMMDATSHRNDHEKDAQVRRSARIRRLLSEETTFRQCPDQVALEKSFEESFCPLSILQLTVWRNRVAQWYYDVVDHLEVPREVVFHAMSFLDRSTALAPASQEQYEIASITALFLAIRLSTKLEMRIVDLLDLCGSSLQVQQVQTNGTLLLQNVSLKSPAVSPFVFAKTFVALLEATTSICAHDLLSMMEAVNYLLELSICDHYFAGVPASKLAFTAVSLCAGCDSMGPRLSSSLAKTLQQGLAQVAGLSREDSSIQRVYDRLLAIYHNSTGASEVASKPALIVDDSTDTYQDSDSHEHNLSTESLIQLPPWTPSSVDLSTSLTHTTTSSSKRMRLC